MKTAVLLCGLLCCVVVAAKTPESEARKNYGEEFARAIEADGWSSSKHTVFTVGKFPCSAACTAGDRIALRVWLNHASVEGTQRFIRTEVTPRVAEMKYLGFKGVEIRGLPYSATYPKGVALMPLD